jgi:1-acyl-sn-glycerol-3-phosphate acyltransferase
MSINDSWKMNKYGKFPMGLGSRITFKIHEPLKVSDFSFDEIFEKTESIIKKHIKTV